MPARTISAMNEAVYSDSPRSSAMNSGWITQPPTMLKPCRLAYSSDIGMPVIKKASNGRTITNPRPVKKPGNCWPVAIWRFLAQRPMKIQAMRATTSVADQRSTVFGNHTRHVQAAIVDVEGYFDPGL
jgi:hypothetical protein